MPSGRSSPVGEIWRYNVCLVIPSSWHRLDTVVSDWPIAAMAKRSLALVILNGRPPLRPRARAEANPAMVRSEINSRSNSASAAKMPNTSLPAAVVSMAVPCPLITLRPISRRDKSCTVLMRCRRSRPSRSSLHITRVSPGRSAFRQAVRPGRSSCLPQHGLHKDLLDRRRHRSVRRTANSSLACRPPSIPSCSQ